MRIRWAFRWAFASIVVLGEGNGWASPPTPPTIGPEAPPEPVTSAVTPSPTAQPVAPTVVVVQPGVLDPLALPIGPPKGTRPVPQVHTIAGTVDYDRRRYEPAGFPIIGGNSDIGFQFGAVATISYFADGVKPYRWNMDLLASASVKKGPSAPEIAQQAYQWNIDAPGLFGGRMRINPQVVYTRTVNEGWYGLGNASTYAVPPGSTSTIAGRFHEFVNTQFQVQPIARVYLRGPVAAMFGLRYRYSNPTAYAGSELEANEAEKTTSGSPLLYGTKPLSFIAPAAGFVYDTRDAEIFTRSGMFHTVGVRYEQGIPFGEKARYGAAGLILTGFVPVWGPFVLAARFLGDLQFGNVPFYDLFQAGPFDLREAPGGSSGIRGVPVGRYAGPIKVIGNVEMRAMWFGFTLLKQSFSIGSDVFFDTGRVWSNYSFRSKADGTGSGLKYGAGVGAYLLWGQAAMLRVDVAYSPDAVAENPTLPLGIYVEDGTMF